MFQPIKPIIQVSQKCVGFKKSKYGNLKYQSPEGETFDSISEYRRWRFLVQLEHAGEISNLSRQPEFDLDESTYTGDFEYHIGTQIIVEDVKSPRLMRPKRFCKIADILDDKYSRTFIIVPVKWIFSRPEVVFTLPLNITLQE